MAKEVKLRMTLDEKGAVTGVEKVGGGFKRMGRSGKTAGQTGHAGFLKIVAGAAVALGAIRLVQGSYRTLTGFIKSSISETATLQDETAKLSHKIGVGTETLSAYHLATELSGTTMEVLAVGLRTVVKNAYDMTQGTGEAKDAFEELGITVTDENGKMKDSEEILLDVADKLMLVDSASRRTALAQKIFGRSGTELLPMMEKGRAGLEALKDEARALGMTFTDETAAAAEEYNDSITRLNGALSGMKMKIGEEVIPVLTDMADWIVKNESLMADLTAAAKGFGTGIVTSVQLIALALQEWYGTVAPFWEKINFLTTTGIDTMKNMSIHGPIQGFVLSALKLGPEAEAHETALAELEKKAGVFGNIAFQIELAQLRANLGIRETTNNSKKTLFVLEQWNKDFVTSSLSALDKWNEEFLTASALAVSNLKEYVSLTPIPKYIGVGEIWDKLAAEKAKEMAMIEQALSGLDLIKLLGVSPGVQTGPNPIVTTAEETVTALSLMKNAALEMGSAGAQAFGQWARGAGTLGVAMRQSTVQVLSNLAMQNMVYAITETAHGLAALAWGNIPGATKHFAAAAQFGLAAGLAGGISRAMSGGEGGMGAPGTASNPAYIQTSPQAANQQIYSDQAGVLVEIKDVLTRIRTLPAGQVVFDGIQQNGGVAALMNDSDKSTLGGEFLDSRYARR